MRAAADADTYSGTASYGVDLDTMPGPLRLSPDRTARKTIAQCIDAVSAGPAFGTNAGTAS